MIQNLILSVILVTNTVLIYTILNNIKNSNDNILKIEHKHNDLNNNNVNHNDDNKNYSNLVIENPVIAPERLYDLNGYEIRKKNNDLSNKNYVKINERTRGEPEEYQLVGMLYNLDVNKNYNLFGRQKYPGSYEWEYYVDGKDVGGNYFKFPLDIKNEIMDNTQIKLPLSSEPFIVKIYDYKEMKYIPLI